MIMNDGVLRVDEMADPVPEKGQVLVRTLACGVCASDIHLRSHGDRLAKWSREFGGPFDMDTKSDLVMGHEYCGEIVDYGPDTSGELAVGSRVTSMPQLFHDRGFTVLGYDNVYPGGFSQYMLLGRDMLRAVPADVPTDAAALTEPLSVGFEYVRIARMRPHDVPLVIGCGAIGLGMIAVLRDAGVSPIVAADYAPMKRALAEQMGAHVVVDPAEQSPMRAWTEAAASTKSAAAVVFECVGVPGTLGAILEAAPWNARVIVAGVCLEPDPVFGAAAHSKAINVQFGGIPIAADFDGALEAISDGRIDVASWITGHAGIEQSVSAFDEATDPEQHARMIVHPHD
jgi:threonine dehydrogenase-like Zn-dependent dehydrogenase